MGLIRSIIEYANRHPVVRVKLLCEYLGVDRDRLYPLLNYLVKRGILIRIKGGLYTIYRDPEKVSSYILQPSYISLFYALHEQGFMEQVPRAIHIVTTRRIIKKELEFFGELIVFYRIKPLLFYGYRRVLKDKVAVLMAYPEKALLDVMYFYGVKVLRIGTIHIEEMNKDRLYLYSKQYPKTIQKTIHREIFGI